MQQAHVVYQANRRSVRWLAAAGILALKAILLIPHILFALGFTVVAMVAAYVGYWIVLATGHLPGTVERLLVSWLRWMTHAYGWYAGIADEYPPYEVSPPAYAFDASVPSNAKPSRLWAAAGTVAAKLIFALPLLVAFVLLVVAAIVVAWLGYVVALFAGRVPMAMQRFLAGVAQWGLRTASWIMGLSDEYPPFTLLADPRR